MKWSENNIFRRCLIRAGIVVAVFVGAGGILWILWNAGAFLPSWITWENSTAQDASGEYSIALSKKKVRVAYRDSIIWTSPGGVKVQKALSFDVDNDRQDELVLLCWKKGHYGEVRPIWIEEDTQEWSQHIFVYEYMQDEVKAKWMSSYIGRDIMDIASNNKEAPDSCLWLTDTEGEQSGWIWDSWGFTQINAN